MSLKGDLETEVAEIFRKSWNIRDGDKVPEAEDVALGNEGVKLDATVLYADISGSTKLVDSYEATFAGEIYKTFLHCAAKIIKDRGGVITAYDGDRIMALFIGDSKNSSAAETALKINYARSKIINPAIRTQYPKTNFQVAHSIGIDTSTVVAARTGVRGSNDLVWIGKAAQLRCQTHRATSVVLVCYGERVQVFQSRRKDSRRQGHVGADNLVSHE